MASYNIVPTNEPCWDKNVPATVARTFLSVQNPTRTVGVPADDHPSIALVFFYVSETLTLRTQRQVGYKHWRTDLSNSPSQARSCGRGV